MPNASTQDSHSFFARVYEIVERIPYGRVVSYGQIARMLGHPRAARTVGWALSACPDNLPWQRVIMSNGSITGGPFAELRRSMLTEEGVPFLPNGHVDIAACECGLAPQPTPISNTVN